MNEEGRGFSPAFSQAATGVPFDNTRGRGRRARFLSSANTFAGATGEAVAGRPEATLLAAVRAGEPSGFFVSLPPDPAFADMTPGAGRPLLATFFCFRLVLGGEGRTFDFGAVTFFALVEALTGMAFLTGFEDFEADFGAGFEVIFPEDLAGEPIFPAVFFRLFFRLFFAIFATALTPRNVLEADLGAAFAAAFFGRTFFAGFLAGTVADFRRTAGFFAPDFALTAAAFLTWTFAIRRPLPIRPENEWRNIAAA